MLVLRKVFPQAIDKILWVRNRRAIARDLTISVFEFYSLRKSLPEHQNLGQHTRQHDWWCQRNRFSINLLFFKIIFCSFLKFWSDLHRNYTGTNRARFQKKFQKFSKNVDIFCNGNLRVFLSLSQKNYFKKLFTPYCRKPFFQQVWLNTKGL